MFTIINISLHVFHLYIFIFGIVYVILILHIEPQLSDQQVADPKRAYLTKEKNI